MAQDRQTFPGPDPMVTPWPAGIRSACLFTFDFDANSTTEFRGVTEPVWVSMGKFGPKVGIPNLLRLLDYFGIKGAFFVPGWVARTYPTAVESLLKAGHEIGHHNDVHEPPTTFRSYAEEEDVILRGVEALAALGVPKPLGYRSPMWELSANTAAILEKHGFAYTSDLMDSLVPEYYEIDGRRSTLLNLPVHWVLDDLAHIHYHISARKTILPCSQVLEHYRDEFNAIHAYGGLFTLTMHPEATGRPSRILMMKTFIEEVLSHRDVWITTPGEVVTYWREAHPG